MQIMAILNVSPDSFSDGGRFLAIDAALAHGCAMAKAGATIIDVGGESSRPQAEPVSEQVELQRVVPVIRELRQRLPTSVVISIDTYKPKVMAAAIEAGAGMINDIYALQQPGALTVARDSGVPVCLMHMQNNPQTMQAKPHYHDIVAQVRDFFTERIHAAEAAGIKRDKLILDPGYGFGKTAEHNLSLLRQQRLFQQFNLPLLAGFSRKSMMGALMGLEVHNRLYASLALEMYAVQQGSQIIRSHDVLASKQALEMLGIIMQGEC